MTRDDVQSAPAGPAGRGGRHVLRAAVGLTLLAALWYFVGCALARGFQRIDWRTLTIDWACLAGAAGALVLARLTNALNCRQVMGALGYEVSSRRAIPVIWFASLGRYIPGKVAAVAGALYMLTRMGLPLHVAASGMFLSVAMMIITGAIAGAPLLFAAEVRRAVPWAGAAAAAAAAVGIVCLHPLVFTRLVNVVLRLLRRPALPSRLATAPYLRAVGITLVRIIILGIALWLAARTVAPVRPADFAVTVAAGGLASVAGFIAVFAPAGLGAHEGVYLLALTPLMGPAAALTVAIFRLLNILCDAVTGAAGMIMLRCAGATGSRTAASSAGGGG